MDENKIVVVLLPYGDLVVGKLDSNGDIINPLRIMINNVQQGKMEIVLVKVFDAFSPNMVIKKMDI